jgi:hypothetical protein
MLSPLGGTSSLTQMAYAAQVAKYSGSSATPARGRDTASVSEEARKRYEELFSEEARKRGEAFVKQDAAANGGAAYTAEEIPAELLRELEKSQVPGWIADITPNIPQIQVGQIVTQAESAFNYCSANMAYTSKVFEHFRSVLQDNGIDIQDTDAKYQNTVVDKEASQKIKEQVYARLREDQEFLGYMDKLMAMNPDRMKNAVKTLFG